MAEPGKGEPIDERRHGMASRARLLGAVRTQHEKTGCLGPPRDQCQQVDRRVIRRVEILEDDDERAPQAERLERLGDLAEHSLPCRAAGALLEHSELVVGDEPRQLEEPARRSLGENGDRLLSLRAAGEPIERIEQRRVRLAGLSRVTLRARDEDPPLGEAAQECLHERGLPDPGLSRDEDDPPVARQRLLEHPAETAELDVTTDEARGVRPGLTGRRSVDCGGPTRDRRLLQLELRILLQHPPLELAQPRRGLDAELLVERTAEVLIAGEGLGLAPRPVEREHLLGVQALAQRVAPQERVELAGELGMSPSRQVGLDSLLEGRQPQLLEVGALDPCERLRELGERRAAPEGERLRQLLRGMLGISSGKTRSPLGHEALEAVEVDAVGRELEQVARRARVQQALGERLAELGDVDLDGLRGAVRDVVPPEVVDEAGDPNRAVEVQDQDGQQRAALATAQRNELAAVADHLERTEDPELQLALDSSSGVRFTGG